MASVIGLHTCPELILSNYEAADRFQVIRELGRSALQHGYVEKPFMPTILEREESYPTGLEISLPIALPHVGESCNRSFLSMAVLKKPVGFYSMDGSGKELKVEIVFLFGITNPQDQVKVLKKFMQVFRDRDSLQILKDAAGPRQVLEILKQLLGNFLIIENLSGKEGE